LEITIRSLGDIKPEVTPLNISSECEIRRTNHQIGYHNPVLFQRVIYRHGLAGGIIPNVHGQSQPFVDLID